MTADRGRYRQSRTNGRASRPAVFIAPRLHSAPTPR